MSTPSVDDFLQGGTKVPTAKFTTVGDKVVGTVVSAEVNQQRDFDTNELSTWPDGNPKMQLVVTLQTDDRDPSIPDDDGLRRIYAKKPSSMLQAIGDAVKAQNSTLQRPGGRLAVAFTGEKPHENPRKNPIKQYAAAYEPPAAAGVDDLLAAPAAQPATELTSAADLLG